MGSTALRRIRPFSFVRLSWDGAPLWLLSVGGSSDAHFGGAAGDSEVLLQLADKIKVEILLGEHFQG